MYSSPVAHSSSKSPHCASMATDAQSRNPSIIFSMKSLGVQTSVKTVYIALLTAKSVISLLKAAEEKILCIEM